MGGPVLIGIDAGTSVIKAVGFGRDGREIAQASRPNRYASLPGGGAEQDMARTWADTAAVLRELGTRIDGLARRVVGLGVTGQGDGTWLIDGDGAPVGDAWLWLDARAGGEAAALASSDSAAEVYRLTGTGVNTCQMRSQLRWMMRHAPDRLARAATALHCKDWLHFRLTGIRATDPTEGVFTFGDFRTRAYSDAAIGMMGLAALRGLLPPILDGARMVHPLTAEAAAETGLPQGLPVSLGYIDIACAALGAGLQDPGAGAGLSILGSTGAHLRLVPDAGAVTLNPDRTGYTLALPGAALAQLQTNMAATLNLDWALGLEAQVLRAAGVERGRDAILSTLDARVMAARPGAALFHPYVSAAGERGPFTDPNARASLSGIDTGTGWDDILRAVCDGLVLAARDCFAAMGPMPRDVRLTGGAARSRALRGLMAAGLGVPVHSVAQEEAGAAGAAMIAALALGEFPDAEAATRAWVHPLLGEAEPPDAALVPVYDALFTAFRATREMMPPAWAAQSTMREALA